MPKGRCTGRYRSVVVYTTCMCVLLESVGGNCVPMDRMVWRMKEKSNEHVSRTENSNLGSNG